MLNDSELRIWKILNNIDIIMKINDNGKNFFAYSFNLTSPSYFILSSVRHISHNFLAFISAHYLTAVEINFNHFWRVHTKLEKNSSYVL